MSGGGSGGRARGIQSVSNNHAVVEQTSTGSAFTTSSTGGLNVTGIAMNGKPNMNGGSHASHRANAAVGGGKLGKSKRSWGALPCNVLHRILDFALEDVPVAPALQSSWAGCAEPLRIILAVTHRVWLCEMRYMSLGWKNAIDSYHFWPEYTLIIEPSKDHASSVHDLAYGRTQPSSPTYSTHFQRALGTTAETCLPCRMNRPDRLGLYPATARSDTASNKFGHIPTCPRHERMYCTNCLRGNMREGKRTMARPDRYNLALVARKDMDEDGYRYVKGDNHITCSGCRQFALTSFVEELLQDSARGGTIHGHAGHIVNESDEAQEYILMGRGHAIDTARAAIEETWLSVNTGYEDCMETAGQLQTLENIVKKMIVNGETIHQNTFEHRLADLHCLLWQAPVVDVASKIQASLAYLNHCEARWRQAIEVGLLVRGEGGLDGLDAGVRQGPTSDHWISYVRQAAIQHFCQERIRSGAWVSPTDEVEGQFERQDKRKHGLFSDLAHNTSLPQGVTHHPVRKYARPNVHFVEMAWVPGAPDTVFPTDGLLRELERSWIQTVHTYLQRPIANIVRYLIVDQGWSLPKLDGILETTEIIQIILTMLRGFPVFWEPFVGQERVRHGHAHRGGERRRRSSRAGSGSRSHSGSETSPVIELLPFETDSNSDSNANGVCYGLEVDEDDRAESDISDYLSEEDASVYSRDSLGPRLDAFDADDDDEEEEEEEEVEEEGVKGMGKQDAANQPLANGNGNGHGIGNGIHVPAAPPPPQAGKRKLDAVAVDIHEPAAEPGSKRRISSDGAVITLAAPTMNGAHGAPSQQPPDKTTRSPPESAPAPKWRMATVGDVRRQNGTPSATNGTHVNANANENGKTSAPASDAVPVQSASPEKSEHSVETASSEPLPKTPEDLGIVSAGAGALAPTILANGKSHGIDQPGPEVEGNDDTTSTAAAAEPALPQAYCDLPHIPQWHDDIRIGPRTEAIIRDLVNHALEPYRECKCGICERGRAYRIFLRSVRLTGDF